MKIGEEACVPLEKFTLEGSGSAGLRYSVRRGERDGLALEIVPPARVAEIIDELKIDFGRLACEACSAGEKRFSVAAFRRDYVMAQTVALLREHERPVAFATVMTTDLKDKATVGLMRLRPDTVSRCVMEYLFIRLFRSTSAAPVTGASVSA